MSTTVLASIMLDVHPTISHLDFPSLQCHQLPCDSIISRLTDASHNLSAKDRCSQHLQQKFMDIICIHKRWKQIESFHRVESRLVVGYEIQCGL